MRNRKEKEALQKALLWVEQVIQEKGLSGRELSRLMGKGESKLGIWKERLPLKVDADAAHGLFRILVEIDIEREEILRRWRKVLDPHWLFGLALVDVPLGEITPAIREEAVRVLWKHFQKSVPVPPAPRSSQFAGNDE